MLLAQAGHHAVVNHHARLIAHHRVTGHAHGQIGVARDVDALQKFSGLRAYHFQLAQRAHIDDAHALANVHRLFAYALHARTARYRVVLGTLPHARCHPDGASLRVQGAHGSMPLGVEAAPGQMRYRHRMKEGPRSGGADLDRRFTGDARQHPQRRHIGMLALAGAHAVGGVALHELDVVVALLRRVIKIFEL